MDELRLSIDEQANDNIPEPTIIPYINGKSLIEIVKEIEAGYDKTIAGAYDGLTLTEFLKEFTKGSFKNSTKHRILECECGSDGCWSLMVMVEEKENLIKWSNIEQIHRQDWDYSVIGEFTFDKQSYLEELEKIEKIKREKAGT